jgi:hypothetical protein
VLTNFTGLRKNLSRYRLLRFRMSDDMQRLHSPMRSNGIYCVAFSSHWTASSRDLFRAAKNTSGSRLTARAMMTRKKPLHRPPPPLRNLLPPCMVRRAKRPACQVSMPSRERRESRREVVERMRLHCMQSIAATSGSNSGQMHRRKQSQSTGRPGQEHPSRLSGSNKAVAFLFATTHPQRP